MTGNSAPATEVGGFGTRIEALEARVEALEEERRIRQVLAKYGFYADFGMLDEWLDLFTDDIVIDNLRFTGDDPLQATPSEFTRFRLTGKREVAEGMLLSAAHLRIQGNCQHHVDGTPAIVELVDAAHAVVRSYGVMYANPPGALRMSVSVQYHNVNRWLFRKEDERWRIAAIVRRAMGAPDAAVFLEESVELDSRETPS